MEHKIEHEEHVLPYDVLDFLHDQKIINHCALSVLKTAFECNGYIAGGFATAFATSVFDEKNDFSFVKKYALVHRRQGHYSVQELKNRKNTNKSLTSFDIDVWFETHACAMNFLNKVSTGEQHATIFGKQVKIGDVISKPTPKQWGTEFLCNNYDANLNLVQAITRITGNFSEITNKFDIYNAACVIKGNVLYVPAGFKELVKSKLLKINGVRTHSPYVMLSRINKWRRKQIFTKGFTEDKDTRDTLLDLADALIKEATSKIGILDFSSRKLGVNFVLEKSFKPMLHHLSDSMLLKLSAYFVSSRKLEKLNFQAYDIFLKQISAPKIPKSDLNKTPEIDLENFSW